MSSRLTKKDWRAIADRQRRLGQEFRGRGLIKQAEECEETAKEAEKIIASKRRGNFRPGPGKDAEGMQKMREAKMQKARARALANQQKQGDRKCLRSQN